ncbi:MAG: outer membrane protein TolC [Halieaceae bacterium]|jgi:outer membrane protein TolC
MDPPVAIVLSRSFSIGLGLFLVILGQSVAQADPGGETGLALLPKQVLESSSRHFPGILESLAAQRAAQGRALAAEGAFDLVFDSQGYNRTDGFYDGSLLGGSLTQPLRDMGASIYGGYDVSRGDFPIYEDSSFTSRDGQVKVGVLFSLLRDRDIDERRFGENDALLELEQAEFDVLLTRIGVQQQALIAYWRWVTAGRKLQVYKELLELAKDRESGLEVQVREGNLAQISLIENLQNITRRQALALSAERNYRAATNALGFYYRGANGEIRFVGSQRLPAETDLSGMSVAPMISVNDSLDALKRRPELLKLKTAMERAQRRAELSENELKPRLDFGVELASGLGDEGEGGPSRDTNDVIVGFEFSVPLERRFAKGRLAEAESDLESLRQQRRELEDQLSVGLRNILLDLDVAKQLVNLASLEVEQSETLRQAESQRFEQGASDFFLVNLREETAADARIRYFIATLERHIARANYDAATVNLPQLGLR